LKNGEAFNEGKIKDPSLVGVHAPDRRTVRVELNNPTPFFLDLCAFATLAVVPRPAIEKYGDRWLMSQPVPVSGPYELVYWRLNDRIRLRKNPRYWDAPNTSVALVDFLPIGSATTALNLYETGGADIVWDKDLVPVELIDVLGKRPDFHHYSELGSYFLRINTTRKPFDDPRVRRALNMAVDKERITRKITRAGELPADCLTPPGIARYHSPRGPAYNPAKARQLLAEAGFPGGKGFPRFQYLFNAAAGGGANIHAKIAVELQQMWRDELGLDMELRQTEWGTYLDAEEKLEYDVCRGSWIGDYNDPDTFLNIFVSNSGNNRTGWTNTVYDGLIDSADRELDPLRREKYFQQAETLLITDGAPIIPIYFYVGFNYYNTNRIRGIYGNIVDMHPLNAIWMAGQPPPARWARESPAATALKPSGNH
jgi:oligopeptide transport system substrate-binding protein